MPHPRFTGTLPRIFRRTTCERGAVPLALAIHMATGATARAQAQGPQAVESLPALPYGCGNRE
jgi:hypothetical protein